MCYKGEKTEGGFVPWRTEVDQLCITGKEIERGFVPLNLKETDYVLQERNRRESRSARTAMNRCGSTMH